MKIHKKWLIMLAVCGAVAAMVRGVRADDDDEGPKGGPPAGQVSLEREMGAMGRDYRIIRTQVADASKNASTLAAVVDLEQHTLAAKGAVLRTATTMPTEEEKKAKQADFQGDMANLLRTELDLEQALLAGKNDKAVKVAADLHDLETEGHKEFRPSRKRN